MNMDPKVLIQPLIPKYSLIYEMKNFLMENPTQKTRLLFDETSDIFNR